MTSPNNSVKLSVVPVVPRRRCRSLGWSVDGVSTTRLRVSDTTRLPLVTILLTLTQLTHTGLAANLPVVDFGRWFFAEHRCPQLARKNFSSDVPEHSTDGFTSSSSEVRPPSCLCWSVTRHRWPMAPPVRFLIANVVETPTLTFQQSCRLRQICHVAGWCPPLFYKPNKLTNYSIDNSIKIDFIKV